MAYDIGPRISIKGETEFNNQIKRINNSVKEYTSEMKALDSQFAENENSMEALTAKNRNLTAQYDVQAQKMRVLEAQRDKEVAKLNELAAALQKAQQETGETSDAAVKAQRAFNEQEATVSKLNVAINETQNYMNQAENAIKRNNAAMSTMSDQTAENEKRMAALRKEAEEANKKFTELASGLGNKVAGGLKALATSAAAAATGVVALVQSTAELRGDMAVLSQNAQEAGVSFDTANNALLDFNAISGETDSSIEAISNLLQAGFSENNLARAVDTLSGAVIRFPDTLKIESLADSLQETLATSEATGQFAELLERLGYNLDEFDAGLQACTSAVDKQEYALRYLARSGLAQTNSAYEEQNEDLLENSRQQLKLQQNLADIGGSFAPLANRAMAALNDTLERLNDSGMPLLTSALGWVIDNGATVISILGGITAGVIAYKGAAVVTDAIKAFQAMKTAIEAANAAQTALNLTQLASPIGLSMAAVGGLIAAFGLLAVSTSESTAEMGYCSQQLGDLNSRLDDVKASMDDLEQSRQESAASIDAEVGANRDLMNELSALMDVEQKSGAQKERIKNIVDQLNYALPDLNLLYDEEADALNMSADAIDNYIDSAEARLRLAAAEKEMQSIIEQQYEVQKALTEATLGREDAQNRMNDLMEQEAQIMENQYASAMSVYSAQVGYTQRELDEYDKTIQELTETQGELDEQMNTVKETAETFAGVAEDGTDAVGDMADATGELSEEVETLAEKYAEVRDSAANSINNQIGLFNELKTESDLSLSEMIQRLNDQATAMTNWGNNLRLAAEMGLDHGLLQKLAEAGPASAGYLQEIVNGGDEAITMMNEAWENQFVASEYAADEMANVLYAVENGMNPVAVSMTTGAKKATSGFSSSIKVAQVTSQVMADTVASILNNEPRVTGASAQTASDATGAFDQNYNPQAGAMTSMAATIATITAQSFALAAASRSTGAAGTEGYISGAQQNAAGVSAVGGTLKNNLVSGANATSQMYNTGMDASRGYANGISAGAYLSFNAAATMAANAIKAAKRAQNSNSPSKEFAKLGEYGSEGYALGFEGKMNDLRPRITRSIQQNIDAASQTSSRGKIVRGQSLTAKDIAKAFQQSGLKLYAGEREIARLQRRLKRA